MPLQSSHVFASHIGHTGKTTLCFQMSSYYAKRNPEVSVLVMDFAEEGDLTKRLLGGVDKAHEKTDELFGGVFRLLSEAEKKATGLTSWLWSQELDITKHAVKVAEHNPSVPPNVYLVSSGAWPHAEEAMSSDTRRKLSENVRRALERATGTWKLFCDTDGDRRPSTLTMLAYNLCPTAIVPLHLSKSDLDRTETMLGMMHDLRQRGEIETQVLCVVWNFVKSLKDEPCLYRRLGDVGLELPFTPTKVCLDILDSCNARLYNIAKDLPRLFVNEAEGEPAFVLSSTLVLRQLADNVLKPSEELGMPFVHMVDALVDSKKKSMRFKSGNVEYEAKDSVIDGAAQCIVDLSVRFDAMEVHD